MKKETPKPSPVLQGAFICIYVVFVSFIFPGVTKLLLQDTIGYWGLIIGIAALIIAGIVGALITCFADAKQLKTMCLLQGVAILLYGIYKILPQVEPDFEWSQVPPVIEKMARSSFVMCFVILACILGFVAFLVIKTMPYVTGIVAMVNTQDSGETKEDEMPEDDDWVAEAIEHLASDGLRRNGAAGQPSVQPKAEDPEASPKPKKSKKPKKAQEAKKSKKSKKAKKQAKKIAKLEREIAERDRQIFCTKWYLRALNLCVAISCGVVLLTIFSLIQLILAGSDAARSVWDSTWIIMGYQQLSLVAQLVLKVVCRAIGAPTDKGDLKVLRKEQKRQKRDLKAWRAR